MPSSKPIKSILKTDSRGSSGSENQSSMDSLGSNSGVHPVPDSVIMIRSDETGPRTRFIFSEKDENMYLSDEKMTSKLKRIEKYATLRIRRPKAKSTDLTFSEDFQRVNSNSSNHKSISPENPKSLSLDVNSDVMTKSMSFLEKSSSLNPNATNGSPLIRQGSLRIRKPSPGWEPCATRTTALRMAKLMESKAKSASIEKPSSSNSGSGESIHNSNNNQTSRPTPSTTPKLSKSPGLGAKVFSKISSTLLGQTTSSAQKRLRQDRGIQTDLSMVRKGTDTVDLRSGTPVQYSPVPSDESHSVGDEFENSQSEQIRNLQLTVSKYRNKSLKYQHACESLQIENMELTNQLRDIQIESKEINNFLQDEKSTLAESLTEAENKVAELQKELEMINNEAQSRCSNLMRLCEQYKQEAFTSYALLKRLESDSNNMIISPRPDSSIVGTNTNGTGPTTNGTHIDIKI